MLYAVGKTVPGERFPVSALRFGRSDDGGRSFAAAQPVSEGESAASYPVLALHHDSLSVAWSQSTAAAYRAKLESAAKMKDPKAPVPLPRVGQSEVFVRTAKL